MRGVKKLLIVTAAVLVLAGCGAREEQLSETPAAPGVENAPIDNEATPEENDIEEQPEVTEPEDETEPENSSDTTEPPAGDGEAVGSETEERTIKVYRTDDQLMELVEAEEVITFSDELEMLEAALEQLQQDGGEGTISLWKEIQFQDVSVEGANVVLDLSIPAEARLGSGGEAFAVEGITNTVFQFEAFETLQLLVDGEQAETLMGHVMLEHPFTK